MTVGAVVKACLNYKKTYWVLLIRKLELSATLCGTPALALEVILNIKISVVTILLMSWSINLSYFRIENIVLNIYVIVCIMKAGKHRTIHFFFFVSRFLFALYSFLDFI